MFGVVFYEPSFFWSVITASFEHAWKCVLVHVQRWKLFFRGMGGLLYLTVCNFFPYFFRKLSNNFSLLKKFHQRLGNNFERRVLSSREKIWNLFQFKLYLLYPWLVKHQNGFLGKWRCPPSAGQEGYSSGSSPFLLDLLPRLLVQMEHLSRKMFW